MSEEGQKVTDKGEADSVPGELISAGTIGFQDISSAMAAGWRDFRRATVVSVAYALLAFIPGLLLLAAVGHFGISPMAPPFAGGFLLVGPAMLAGFFHIARTLEQGGKPGLADPYAAFFRAPPAIWLVAVFCLFMFLIWITDAGVIYGFLIGGQHLPYELPWLLRPSPEVMTFLGWGSLMGAVLAFIVYAVAAFSVPLLFERRAALVSAVNTSVRAVFKSFLPCLAWALLLGTAIIGSIVLLPLLLVVLPVMAYAGFFLYRSVLPPSDTA